MAERPQGLQRISDKLVLAVCVLLSTWMMTWDESTRVRRGAAWLHTIVTPIEWADSFTSDLIALQSENAELRARVTALEMDLAHLEHGRLRLEQLEARAGFYERSRGRLAPADVLELIVARTPVQAKIRTYGDDSLKTWMPVISEDGLVGRIRQVLDDDLALVQLLTEEDSRISVEVVRTGVTGLLRFDGRGFHMDHVPQGDPIRGGDELITSGLGGTVPRGLVVGRVTQVRSSASELFQEVEVEPAVRFSALRRVFVVTRPGPWYADVDTPASADSDSTVNAAQDTSDGDIGATETGR